MSSSNRVLPAPTDGSGPAGLSRDEAARRLLADGPNALPEPPRRGLLRLALEVLREPMFLLLTVAAAVYLVVGDLGEGLMLAAFAVMTIGLVAVQEARSERALAALRALGAPTARVLREGQAMRIASSAVVRGDCLLVAEGERVAADALLRRAESLAVDESLLTGESVPVGKVSAAGDLPSVPPGGDASPWIYSGTLVVRGHGVAEVVHTGLATQAGRIGVSLATIESSPTPLQRTIGRLVRVFGACALALSVALVVLYGLLRGDWLEGSLAGIAFSMAMLPEEFPMVLAVFLALGAWRLARVHVLVRRPAVVETLGATSVVCLDKTGTLTENRMRVRALVAGTQGCGIDGPGQVLPPAFRRLVEVAVLASNPRAVDPMDRALIELGAPPAARVLVREYGLTDHRPMLVHVWQGADGALIAAAKGAPEAIATLCGLDAAARAAAMRHVDELARGGARVLGVAAAVPGDLRTPPDDPSAMPFEWQGLVAFEDPLRASARDAVARLRAAGIAVTMITGDLPQTALAIAAAAGIDITAGAVTGAQIDAMDTDMLAATLASVRVFARVRPEQKLRLIEAFKASGQVVGMTGDGVNDAPALKAAHVGLAMGARATDVAREAAAIVLLDDDLGHLVDGVREGRRIYDNLQKAMSYIVAIHVPIAGLALLPVLAGLPPLLLPAHVVLTEMVIDPVCSIAFETMPGDPDALQKKPRDIRAAMLGPGPLGLAAVQGMLVLAAALGVFALAHRAGVVMDEARALAFVALTAGNLALVRVNAAPGATLPHLLRPGYGAYWTVATVAVAVVGLCLWLPPLASLFRFVAPSVAATAVAALAGAAAALSFDVIKAMRSRARMRAADASIVP
ncbi:cation-translocating P-type ATPase [Chiayiivirga flava]|uniref:Ca2+-transporting ATPase n=1 Tax=Chiayiivirga flava TaxID=659595 RepID=A0A7W8D271_9GAMM|nr:HAD-IC family P-type ATPase [Chiayiivirga flava]MBB5206546.1 Ca2+-transporting ATPase [Chiayiivirga flava]